MKPKYRSLRAFWHSKMHSKTVTLGGVTLQAEAHIVGNDVRNHLIRGEYEFAELYLLRTLLKPGDRVLEFGAGLGAIGLAAARIVGAENVISFEANPRLETVIRENYRLNSLEPELCMQAVTVDGTPVTFHITASMLSSSIHDRGETEEVTVESTAINDAIKTHAPSVLVVDVEGAETDLLPAADLDGVRAILVETHAKVTGQDAVDEMVTALLQKGFSVKEDLHRNLLLERSAN